MHKHTQYSLSFAVLIFAFITLSLRLAPVFAVSNTLTAFQVIGQSDFVSGAVHLTQDGLRVPDDAIVIGGKFIVADQQNDRVLIWNTVPTSNGTPADVVIGQPNFMSDVDNNGGRSDKSLNKPSALATDGTKLLIADRNNNRVLIYNTVPTTNFASANVVIGQSLFNGGTANQGTTVGPNTLSRPDGLFYDGDRLYIGDVNNNRILIFDDIPTSNNASGVIALGQPNLTSGTFNNGGRSATTLGFPHAVYSDGTHLFVSEEGNNRVLIWNTLPTASGQAANVVIGQPDFTTGSGNQGGSVGANTISNPAGQPRVFEGKLYIPDSENHRVLVFNTIPTVNNTPANYVLGQADLQSAVVNPGGVGATTMTGVAGVFDYAGKLYVMDGGNSRILVFDVTDPTGSMDIDESPATATTSVNLSLFASDNKDSSSSMQMHISNDSDFSTGTFEVFSATKNWTLLPGLGNRTVHIRYKDSAGNISSTAQESIVLDSTNPTGSIVLDDGETFTANAEIDVSLTNHDEVTEVTHFKLSEDEDFIGVSWEAYTDSTSMTLSENDGLKTVYVKFKDSANNESDIYSDTITLDTAGPVGSVNVATSMIYTKTTEVNVTLSATDEHSGVTEMILSENSSFTGAVWEAYSSTKELTLSEDEGLKTIYAKFRDDQGNESQIVLDTITLDTHAPSTAVITKLGIIPNIPDRNILFYYFTSQAPHISGTAEAGSSVFFKAMFDDQLYSTTVNESGHFTMTLTNPVLPRGTVKLQYYVQDAAGNKSVIKTLNLLIGVENFPLEVSEEEPEISPTPSVTIEMTPTPTPTVTVTEIPPVTTTQVPAPTEKTGVLNLIAKVFSNIWKFIVDIFN